MEILYIITLYFIVILSALFLFNFKWCINTLREIASPKNQGGYTKLVQMALISFLCIIFFLIIRYYIRFPAKVDKLDVILTVIVGWLGLIFGAFFGEKSMENLHEKQEQAVKKTLMVAEKFQAQKNNLLNIIEEDIKKSKKKVVT